MTPFRLLVGDAIEQLRTLPDESVQTCVTSPPYWGLRDYGVEGQIGLEPTSAEFIGRLLEVFREWCLGTTKSGAPRHPLYVRGDQPLEVFR